MAMNLIALHLGDIKWGRGDGRVKGQCVRVLGIKRQRQKFFFWYLFYYLPVYFLLSKNIEILSKLKVVPIEGKDSQIPYFSIPKRS